MIHWVFHTEHNLVQDKFLMEKCWSSHVELRTEANLVLIKDQVCLYEVDPLRVLGLVTLMLQVLKRVILYVIYKELGLEIK